MKLGPFARLRQAKKDDKELGQGLWRQAYDRFNRSLERYWQIVETADSASTLSAEELNGLRHAGNVLSENLKVIREICLGCNTRFPEDGLRIPGAGSDIHRAMSRASNDLATTAQAVAMYKRGQTSNETVGRRAEKVIASVRDAQELYDRLPS